MADNCNRCDPVEKEAQQLTRMLDSGRNTEEVANALRNDSYNMSPRDFGRMVNSMMRNERKDRGDNIEQDRDGNLIIDTGRQGLVIATRDFDERQRYAQQHNGSHRRNDDRGGYDRYGERGNDRDAVTDGVVNGAIGAAIGGAIDGKKGAIAGGAAGVGNVIVDRVGGDGRQRDDVEDVVVKGAIGAAIGGVIDGKKGAISGGAASVGANVIDKIFNKRRD